MLVNGCASLNGLLDEVKRLGKRSTVPSSSLLKRKRPLVVVKKLIQTSPSAEGPAVTEPKAAGCHISQYESPLVGPKASLYEPRR